MLSNDDIEMQTANVLDVTAFVSVSVYIFFSFRVERDGTHIDSNKESILTNTWCHAKCKKSVDQKNENETTEKTWKYSSIERKLTNEWS